VDSYNTASTGLATTGGGSYSIGAGAATEGATTGTTGYGGGYGTTSRQSQRGPDLIPQEPISVFKLAS
jgi:hypothetical protein